MRQSDYPVSIYMSIYERGHKSFRKCHEFPIPGKASVEFIRKDVDRDIPRFHNGSVPTEIVREYVEEKDGVQFLRKYRFYRHDEYIQYHDDGVHWGYAHALDEFCMWHDAAKEQPHDSRAVLVFNGSDYAVASFERLPGGNGGWRCAAPGFSSDSIVGWMDFHHFDLFDNYDD